MKPAITTITLLVANVLVLGYILLIDRHRDDTETANFNRGNLAIFEGESVVRMRIDTAEGSAEVVRQPDGSWRFVAPFEDRFDPGLMEELLGDAGRLRIYDTVTEKELEDEGWGDDYFGFGEGAIGLQMFDPDGNLLSAFELGAPTPVEGSVYARRGLDGGGDVHTVAGYLRDLVSQPFNDLRDRRLIYAKVDEVFRVKFRPPPASTLEVHVEKPKNRWGLVHPLKARCDEDLVKELVAKLAKLEVAEFVDQPGAEMETAFDENRYEIVLRQRSRGSRGSDNPKITIKFGKAPVDEADPYILASVSDREGVLFRIDRNVLREFEINGNTLRDRSLADYDYQMVTGLRIQRKGSEEIILNRLREGWVLQPDPADPKKLVAANGRMVKDLIGKINDEEILDFASDAAADLAPFGLEDPPLEVSIIRDFYDVTDGVVEGEEPKLVRLVDTLMLGVGFVNQPGGEAFAAFKGEHHVYKIANFLPPAIARMKPLNFRALQMWPRFSQLDLRRITLEEKGAEAPLVLEYFRERDSWTAMLGDVDVTGDINRVVLDGYLEYLGRPPRGEDWTKAGARSIQRLADPELTLTIELTDPQDQVTPRTIRFIASATADGAKLYYGRINRGADVVLLGDEVIRAMRVPLRKLTE